MKSIKAIIQIIIVLFLWKLLIDAFSIGESVLLLLSYTFGNRTMFGDYLVRSFLVMSIWLIILQIIPFFRRYKIWKPIVVIYVLVTWVSFDSICCWKIELSYILEYFQNEEIKEIPITLYYLCSQLIMLCIYSLLSILVNKGISTTLCELLDD